MRRRGQGEDARCAVPWKGATRRLMSRGRLCHAKARGRESPVPRAAVSNLAVRPQPRSERRPLKSKEPRLRSGGRTNQHPDQSTTASGAGGKTGFAAPTAGSGPGRDPRTHPRRGGQDFKGPKTLQAPPRGSGETRERLAPLKLSRELRRPGSDRRSRAGRERRSSPKGTEARRRAGPPTLRTGDGRPVRTRTRHHRRTAIPGKGPPPPGCCFKRGRTGRTEARRTDRARRHPGAFAWQVSVARIPNVDKSKVCSDTNFLCISLFLFHIFYTYSPQSYPHSPQRRGVGKNRSKAGFRNSARRGRVGVRSRQNQRQRRASAAPGSRRAEPPRAPRK